MKTTIKILAVLIAQIGFGQIGGNHLYENNNYYRNSQNVQPKNIQKLTVNGNSMNFQVKILNNVKATSFVITLGLNQEGKTVKESNSEINSRISKFKTALKSFGVKEDDVYVDFVSQTKIYDYQSKTTENQVKINQVENGFEIKKNIIIKVNNISIFDSLVEKASEYDIYNIIKVDYYTSQTDDIYRKMLEEAHKIIKDRKKQTEFKSSDWEDEPLINIEFHHIQPSSQYNKFQAFESSEMSYINDYYNSKKVVRHELRKSNSFYFRGQSTEDFDKIINADTPLIGLQFVMNVSVSYTKKVNQKDKKQYHIITPNGDVKNLPLN